MLKETNEEYFMYRLRDKIYRVPTHGFIVKIIDWGRHPSTHFLFHVSEYCVLTLNDIIGEPFDKVCEIIFQKLKENYEIDEEDYSEFFKEEIKEYETKTSWEYYSEDLLEILKGKIYI